MLQKPSRPPRPLDPARPPGPGGPSRGGQGPQGPAPERPRRPQGPHPESHRPDGPPRGRPPERFADRAPPRFRDRPPQEPRGRPPEGFRDRAPEGFRDRPPEGFRDHPRDRPRELPRGGDDRRGPPAQPPARGVARQAGHGPRDPGEARRFDAPPGRPAPPGPPAFRGPGHGPGPREPRPLLSTGKRLSKWLTEQGQASRREADDWIAAGWVRVDGRLAVLGQRVQGHERIDIDPAARQQQRRRVTVLLNKPVGYVSGQAEDGYQPASVLVTLANRWPEDRGLPWHPAFLAGLAPAGRLDIDSTGLLVLTQDGRVAKHLIGEDSDVEKEYLVRVEPLQPDAVPPDVLERLQHGLELDGRQLKPAKVSWANEDQLRFVLREGRKRQIRRMCELVGLKVVGLKRVRIGSVVLGKLPAGQWRLLRDDERF
ncbi:MAG: pseudouridine synthase [Rubrivivax sp.]|nr:pseudouridine synthase [Rubrivivax sp.]